MKVKRILGEFIPFAIAMLVGWAILIYSIHNPLAFFLYFILLVVILGSKE